MRKKIISKGFTPKKSGGNEYFEGEFNGTDVQLFIATNNNKVYRIMLCDVNTLDEANIRIRFNKLVGQFEKNKKYLSLVDQTIPDDEDISYQMMVNSKVYEAIFYQKPDTNKLDMVALEERIKEEIIGNYTQEELDNLNEDVKNEIIEAALDIEYDLISKKPVWFRICEYYGEYYITMFYDNEYNHADGEDL